MRYWGIRALATVGALTACLVGLLTPLPAGAARPSASGTVTPAGTPATDTSTASTLSTATPIKHLVVIFQENISFDHYFATYPNALNPPGEPAFTPLPNTPSVNNLSNAHLLTGNPNLVQPFRLDRKQALTCDQNHDYTAEQQAFDGGKMDKFVQYTDGSASNSRQYCPTGITMGYYDGNTVTAMWNYAQHFAMSDNSWGTTFGPSTPGVLNLIAGDTAGAVCGPPDSVFQGPGECTTTPPPTTATGPTGTVYGDPDQYYDDCSSGGTTKKSATAAVTSPNVGESLTGANITWGWFNGGFDNCNAKHPQIALDLSLGIDPSTDTVTSGKDYSAHHEGFQYFAATSNSHHLTPGSPSAIGSNADQANHQYDLTDFWTAADAGNLPAVSYLKAPRYQDGHPGNSNPLDEQQFLVETINHLESLPSWKSTAVIIAWDDSDGWYDHVPGPIVNHSNTSIDADPRCMTSTDGAPGRCGYGPRLPLMVISPYARANFVDHTLTDQSSILRFIEDNWLGGARMSSESFDNKAGSLNNMFDFSPPHAFGAHRLFLDPLTGEPLRAQNAFVVSFTSAHPGQGYIMFGPSCSGLVYMASMDAGAGTTYHSVQVTGDEMNLESTALIPGATYAYETVTVGPNGVETDNNHGVCYRVTVAK